MPNARYMAVNVSYYLFLYCKFFPLLRKAEKYAAPLSYKRYAAPSRFQCPGKKQEGFVIKAALPAGLFPTNAVMQSRRK